MWALNAKLAKTLFGSDLKNLGCVPVCTLCTALALNGFTQRSGIPYCEMYDAFSTPVFINILAVQQSGEGVKGSKMDSAIRSKVLPNPNLLYSTSFQGVASHIPVFLIFKKFSLTSYSLCQYPNSSYSIFLPEPEQQCNESA